MGDGNGAGSGTRRSVALFARSAPSHGRGRERSQVSHADWLADRRRWRRRARSRCDRCTGLTYFGGRQCMRRACNHVGVAALGLTSETFLIPSHTIVTTLINELAEIDDEIYVFLDDYHRI